MIMYPPRTAARRRQGRASWRLITLLVIPLLIAISAALWMWRPRPPAAVAILEIRPSTPLVTPDAYDVRFDTNRSNRFKAFKQGQLAMIKSDFVITGALASHLPTEIGWLPVFAKWGPPIDDRDDDRVDYIRSRLEVFIIGSSDLIEVRMTSNSQNVDQHVKILNAIIACYIDHRRQDGLSQLSRFIESLEGEHVARRKVLESLVEELQSKKSELGEEHAAVFLLRQDLAEEREIYREISRRLLRLKTNASVPGCCVRMLEEAHVESD